MPVLRSSNTDALLISMAQETPFAASDYCERIEEWAREINREDRLLDRLLINTIENISMGNSHRMLTSQQIMLGAQDNLVVRLNLWPTLQDRGAHTAAELDRYSYEAAHDHNFSFLTIGHEGPGYRTEIYEYDRDRVRGVIGEDVDLRFKRTTLLAKDEHLWFRSGRDVHTQYTPHAFSASLNILIKEDGEIEKPQYYFDIDRSKIVRYTINNVSKQLTVLDTCTLINSDLCRDVIDFYARQTGSRVLREYAAAQVN